MSSLLSVIETQTFTSGYYGASFNDRLDGMAKPEVFADTATLQTEAIATKAQELANLAIETALYARDTSITPLYFIQPDLDEINVIAAALVTGISERWTGIVS